MSDGGRLKGSNSHEDSARSAGLDDDNDEAAEIEIGTMIAPALDLETTMSAIGVIGRPPFERNGSPLGHSSPFAVRKGELAP
jgi:hypothetical protein